mgnify:CR=1 FL=1
MAVRTLLRFSSTASATRRSEATQQANVVRKSIIANPHTSHLTRRVSFRHTFVIGWWQIVHVVLWDSAMHFRRQRECTYALHAHSDVSVVGSWQT